MPETEAATKIGGLTHDHVPNCTQCHVRQLAEYKIDPQVLTDMPYSIWATEDAEIALQVINEVGIQDFVEGMVLDPEMKTWNVQSYIQKKYPAHWPTRKLFEDDYDQMLSHFAPDSAAKS